MKVTTLIFLLGLFVNVATAQNCDIAQTGVAVYNSDNTAPISSINTGENANFKFSVANFGTSLGCTIPANSVTAVFNIPTLPGGIHPYVYDGPATFNSGFFTWVYDAATESLQGRNSLAIPNGQGDIDILVKVKGIMGGTAISDLNLVPASGGSDNTANNVSRAQLIVMAGPVPIKLSEFTVKPDRCNALLNWRTSTESNFNHFDVEYSVDAITYIKIGAVNGRNSVNGASYNFAYTQLSGVGYYRLKLVDNDGKFEYSNVVRTSTTCKDNEKILVYPNPVNQDQVLSINISGYIGKLSGEMFTDAGQRVASYELVNGTNTESVSELTTGIYMLRIRNNTKEVASFKIIVTK